MEKNWLALVLNPRDPSVFTPLAPPVGKPTFVIVIDMVDLRDSARSLAKWYRVRYDNYATEILPRGRLVPLLELSEEDATQTPTEAFTKWAPDIVRQQALAHLPGPQRDFLFDLLPVSDVT